MARRALCPLCPLCLVAIAATLTAAAGCAHTIGERDALGNPKLERIAANELARLAAAHPAPLTVEDLVRLSSAGSDPQAIIDRYELSHSRPKLTSEEVADLRQRGVDQRVLDHIVGSQIDAERTAAITAQADRDAEAYRRLERQLHYRYYDPWWSGYPYVYPYLGYGWRSSGSGWYGGVGISF